MRLDAAFGFLRTAKGDLFERAIRPFLCFVSPRLLGGFKKAFVLRWIVGLGLWFLLHDPTI